MHRVMVVDDEVLLTIHLEERLSAMGYEVVGQAFSGEEAVEIAKKLRPDVILMDIVIPGKIDGIAAAELIKAALDIPVIFLTAYTECQLIERAKQVEPFGYIVKPFHERELKAVIEVALYKKEVDLRLREAKEFAEGLMSSMKDGFNVLDKQGVHLDVNPSFCRMTGFTRKELIGTGTPHLYWPEEEYETIQAAFQKILEGSFEEFELVFKRKNGKRFPVIVSPSCIKDKKGNIVAYCTTFKDITRRKKREQEIIATRARLRHLLESSPAVIYSRKPVESHSATFVSDNVKLLLGCEARDFLDNPDFWVDHIHPDDVPLISAGFSNVFEKGFLKTEYRFQHKDGSYRWLRDEMRLVKDARGNPVELVGYAVDVTKEKQLEEELLNAQKLESLGILAGGIAHDFNNLLWVIIANTDMALESISDGPIAQRNLNRVFKAAHDAKDLVKQILTFSRQTKQARKQFRVGPVVKETLHQLMASLPSTIVIRQDIATEFDTVLSDPIEIQRIIVNLYTNAVHAMHDTAGTLEVSLNNVNFDSPTKIPHPDIKPGLYIKLTVRDTGHGMDRSVRKRIFDPYFTTKKKGEGSGLGLAVVHGIVKSHGGAIVVDSKPGEGTTFQVFLPIVDQVACERTEVFTPVTGGNERILFVDDEEALVEIVQEMLERLGYEVVVKTSAIEALKLFQAQPQKFDLVITDQAMPQMTGVQLSKELMHIRPDIPIILCTGYSEAINELQAKAMGIKEFVIKPISKQDISKIIRQALER